jgi:hypothetical protein
MRDIRQIVDTIGPAADALQSAIYQLGVEYRQFSKLVRGLQDAKLDLSHAIESAIVAHLANAGLASLIGRNPQGSPGALRDVIERLLAKSGVTS